MNMEDYQYRTPDTAVYGEGVYDMLANDFDSVRELGRSSTTEKYLRVAYCAIKLNGEAGEVAEEVGKALRDDAGKFTTPRLVALVKELGDCMWYISQIHNELDLLLKDTMELNILKLKTRKEIDAIHGRGNDR